MRTEAGEQPGLRGAQAWSVLGPAGRSGGRAGCGGGVSCDERLLRAVLGQASRRTRVCLCGPKMEDWASAVIGVGILVVICCCGELARLVAQDDEKMAAEAAGRNPAQPKLYMGAPMRMQFKTFDVSSKKKKKQQKQKQQQMAYIDDVTPLDLDSVTKIDSDSINLTPRDVNGNEQLLSASELAQGAPPLRRSPCCCARHRAIAVLELRRQQVRHDLIRKHVWVAVQSPKGSM